MPETLDALLGSPSGWLFSSVLAGLWNRRNAALNAATFDALALGSDDRVLEVGFGGGWLLRRMAAVVENGDVSGVDVSGAMVSLARRRLSSQISKGSIRLLRARAEALPFLDNGFSKICSVNSMFYWDDQQVGLTELWRVLRPGGRFVLCLTRKSDLEARRFARRLPLLDEHQLFHLLEKTGFSLHEAKDLSDRYRTFHCIVSAKDAGV